MKIAKKQKIITGSLLKFSEPFKLADFGLEHYNPGLFGDVTKIKDIPITWNGNKVGTIRAGQIYENETGIYIKQVKINKHIANDIHIGFSFTVNKDSWKWANSESSDMDERTVKEAKLHTIIVSKTKK